MEKIIIYLILVNAATLCFAQSGFALGRSAGGGFSNGSGYFADRGTVTASTFSGPGSTSPSSQGPSMGGGNSVGSGSSSMGIGNATGIGYGYYATGPGNPGSSGYSASGVESSAGSRFSFYPRHDLFVGGGGALQSSSVDTPINPETNPNNDFSHSIDPDSAD